MKFYLGSVHNISEVEIAKAKVKAPKHDEFSCYCCGAGLLDDGSCCPACEAAECGEQDIGAPCRAKGRGGA